MATVEQLENKRRSLTAEIRAAKKAEAAAEQQRVKGAKGALGDWLLVHLFGDSDDTCLDARIASVRSALEEPQVVDYLRQQVRAAQPSARPAGPSEVEGDSHREAPDQNLDEGHAA